jgi:hypothetical protein
MLAMPTLFLMFSEADQKQQIISRSATIFKGLKLKNRSIAIIAPRCNGTAVVPRVYKAGDEAWLTL